MDNIKYRQVHWQDGMKLNKDHFIFTDNFHLEQQIFTRSINLNENNFGVLPSHEKSKQSFEIKLSVDGNFIHITKYKISALMLNGMFVNVDSDEITTNNTDIENIKIKFRFDEYNDKKFVLVLTANSFQGIGYGKYDSEDLPIRRPFLLPNFNFELKPLNKVKESYYSNDFFVLLRFDVEHNQIKVDENYIPPVTSLASNRYLTDKHTFVLDSLNSIENYLTEIAKKQNKKKGDNYADTMLLLSNNLINYISIIKFQIKHNLLYKPPIEIIIKIKSLANIFYKTLEGRTSIGKDTLLNEVYSIAGIPKNEFEELFKQIINLEYRHFNIYDSITAVVEFLSILKKLFKSLSEGELKPKGRKFDIKA